VPGSLNSVSRRAAPRFRIRCWFRRASLKSPSTRAFVKCRTLAKRLSSGSESLHVTLGRRACQSRAPGPLGRRGDLAIRIWCDESEGSAAIHDTSPYGFQWGSTSVFGRSLSLRNLHHSGPYRNVEFADCLKQLPYRRLKDNAHSVPERQPTRIRRPWYA